MKSILTVLGCFLILLLCPQVAMAAKWSNISESQSLIYSSLNAEHHPYVDKYYKQTGWDDSYRVRSYWLALNGNTEKNGLNNSIGMILYHDTAPGVFFPNISGPEEKIKGFGFFQSGYSLSSSKKFHKSSSVHMEYIELAKGMRKCIVFVGKAGGGGGDGQLSDGTSYFKGFWCNPTGEELDQNSIDTILNSIGIKEEGVIAPSSMPTKTNKKTTSSVSLKDKESSLRDAKNLFEKELISQEQYDKLKSKILGLD